MAAANGNGWVVGLSATLVGLLALGASLVMNAPAPLTEVERWLATVGVSLDLPPTATPLDVQEHDGVLTSMLVADGDVRLRVKVTEGLSWAEAAVRAADQQAVITGLFEDHQAPYPGQLSNTLTCPDTYLPSSEVLKRGLILGALHLYANDRLAYGGCSPDLLRYRSTVAWAYDGATSRLFTLEYHIPIDRPDIGMDVMNSLTSVIRVEE